MPQDPIRCPLWTRKAQMFRADRELARQMMQDAIQPDPDEQRRERMIARAEFEEETTTELVNLATRMVDLFCG